MAQEKRRVVITGAGVLSPLADSPAAFHEALCEGRTGFRPVSLFELDGLTTRRGGEISDFEPETYLGKGNFRPLDRTARLAAAATRLALESSGIERAEGGDELGLVLGTMFGSVRTIAEFDRRALVAGPQYVKPFDFANSVINAAAGQAAIWHGLRGVNSTVAGGATAGLQALAYATEFIRSGRAEVLVAGGVEELCFESFFGFAKTGRLAPGDGAGEGTEPRAVPLEARRNGFLLGEGAALFVLEEAETAGRRGATVLAEVLGHASAFDVSRGLGEERAARAVARSLALALEDAGVSPDEIDAASLAANGSRRGDRHEALGFAAAFGDRARRLPATAVKAALGEALGASGAFQTLALVESLARGVLPGIAGLEERDEELPLEAVGGETQEIGRRRGIVHALGLDGATCSLVLGAGASPSL